MPLLAEKLDAEGEGRRARFLRQLSRRADRKNTIQSVKVTVYVQVVPFASLRSELSIVKVSNSRQQILRPCVHTKGHIAATFGVYIHGEALWRASKHMRTRVSCGQGNRLWATRLIPLHYG